MTAVKMFLKAKCAANVEGRLPKFEEFLVDGDVERTHTWLGLQSCSFSFSQVSACEEGEGAFVQLRKGFKDDGQVLLLIQRQDFGHSWLVFDSGWFQDLLVSLSEAHFCLSKLSFLFVKQKCEKALSKEKAAFSWDDCVLRLPTTFLLLI